MVYYCLYFHTIEILFQRDHSHIMSSVTGEGVPQSNVDKWWQGGVGYMLHEMVQNEHYFDDVICEWSLILVVSGTFECVFCCVDIVFIRFDVVIDNFDAVINKFDIIFGKFLCIFGSFDTTFVALLFSQILAYFVEVLTLNSAFLILNIWLCLRLVFKRKKE